MKAIPETRRYIHNRAQYISQVKYSSSNQNMTMLCW